MMSSRCPAITKGNTCRLAPVRGISSIMYTGAPVRCVYVSVRACVFVCACASLSSTHVRQVGLVLEAAGAQIGGAATSRRRVEVVAAATAATAAVAVVANCGRVLH